MGIIRVSFWIDFCYFLYRTLDIKQKNKELKLLLIHRYENNERFTNGEFKTDYSIRSVANQVDRIITTNKIYEPLIK